MTGPDSPSVTPDVLAPRTHITAQLSMGAHRLFADWGLASIEEFVLPSGRRVDVAGLDAKGAISFAEIKSCPADFTADQKWPEYVGFCDQFYFVVDDTFPRALIPSEAGLIVADRFGAGLVRPAPVSRLAPARRKALTLRFARAAAQKWARAVEAF